MSNYHAVSVCETLDNKKEYSIPSLLLQSYKQSNDEYFLKLFVIIYMRTQLTSYNFIHKYKNSGNESISLFQIIFKMHIEDIISNICKKILTILETDNIDKKNRLLSLFKIDDMNQEVVTNFIKKCLRTNKSIELKIHRLKLFIDMINKYKIEQANTFLKM